LKTRRLSTFPRESGAELKARALRLLARREHSRAELARKLAPHAESFVLLEKLLSELESRKQLSEERFAEGRARVLSRKYGAAKIRQDLKSKGIADDIVDRVSSEGEVDTARRILARKYREPATTREELAKRMRFLQGRGFSYEVIRSALSTTDDQ
jgi:regulatory protein